MGVCLGVKLFIIEFVSLGLICLIEGCSKVLLPAPCCYLLHTILFDKEVVSEIKLVLQ